MRAAFAAHADPALARVVERLDPGVVESARGATLVMRDGTEVVDLASGGFGYGHPRVAAAVAEQLSVLPLSSRVFVSRPLARLVERLASLAPGALEVAYPCNSAAEAMEGALKLARGRHPRRTRVVAFSGAWHGGTVGALSACGIPAVRDCFHSLPLQLTAIRFGDARLLDAIDGDTCAVVVEPVPSTPGVIPPPPGFLAALRRRCTAAGAVLVADETVTGLGRTGRRFAVDHDGVVPDVLVIGGALGGGVVPAAAYLTTRELNRAVYGRRDPVLHGATTAGNPLACAAALAALAVVEEEGLARRCAVAGLRLAAAVERMRARFAGFVSSTAGVGLLAGLRLREGTVAAEVQREALARGVLVRLDDSGVGGCWIGLRPPLLVSDGELDAGLHALEAVLAGAPVHAR